MNVLSLISNQINNLFSDVLHTKKIGFVEKIRFKRFQVKVDLTLRKMINKSDCTILTSDLFERFMKYHHPFEKMILNISGKGDSILSKERFIEKQIDLFLNTNDISNENPIDKIIMMDLFTKIYVLIENYYIKDLSKNEKYVIGVIEKVKDNISTEIVENAHKVIDVVKNESDEIKKMVSRLGVIDDSDLLCSIYFAFSKEILNGRASEVYSLYPLLNGKSNDLELGIAYLFKIFSNRIVDDVDFSTIQERIRNEQIYSDLAQKTIYYSLLEKDDELLNSINDRNLDIYDIKCHLQAKNYNVFFTTQTEQKDGMFYVEYKLTDNFPEYKWIVRKICMFSILEQHLVNSVQFIESMLSENYFVIDQVLLAEKEYKNLALFPI